MWEMARVARAIAMVVKRAIARKRVLVCWAGGGGISSSGSLMKKIEDHGEKYEKLKKVDQADPKNLTAVAGHCRQILVKKAKKVKKISVQQSCVSKWSTNICKKKVKKG